ncbi:TolC family outer membrane protein [Candidatus Endolissoclinum faulkneri]|nr:TolC family outer membrane protein [Candidatus Endolissoclinum faulkneri]
MILFAKLLSLPATCLALITLAAVISSISIAHGQNLKEVLSITYENNPELLAARARLRQTDEYVTQAKSGWRPTINVSANFGITHVNAGSRGVKTADSSSYPITGLLTANQPLYTFGRVDSEINKAKLNVKIARADLFEMEQNTLYNAVVSYMNVIRDAAILDLQINNSKHLNKQLEATKERLKLGEITRTDVAQSEARQASADAERTKAESNLTKSRTAFESVIGSAPTILTKPEIPPGLPNTRKEAVSIALRENYSISQAKSKEMEAKYVVSHAESELLPKISLIAQAEQSYNTRGYDNNTSALSAEVQLFVPIYQKGTVYSQIRSAKEEVNRLHLLVDATRRGVIEKATRTYEDYKAAIEQIKSLRLAVSSSQLALEGIRQEANIGNRSVLDILDAEHEQLEAKVALVSADRNAIVAAFSLLASLGRLSAQELALPVKIYDYNWHYTETVSQYYGTKISQSVSSN